MTLYQYVVSLTILYELIRPARFSAGCIARLYLYSFISTVTPDLNSTVILSSKTATFSISRLISCSSYSARAVDCFFRNVLISAMRFLSSSRLIIQRKLNTTYSVQRGKTHYILTFSILYYII